MKRKKRLSQAELKQLGVQPGLQAVRYAPGGERVQVRQLTSEASGRPSLFYSKTPALEGGDSEQTEGE